MDTDSPYGLRYKLDSPYRLRYKIDHELGTFSKDDNGDGEFGLTDALVIGSILSPPDSCYSQLVLSVDGRNEGADLSGKDLFKFWMVMAAALKDRTDLSEIQRAFVLDTCNKWKIFMGV